MNDSSLMLDDIMLVGISGMPCFHLIDHFWHCFRLENLRLPLLMVRMELLQQRRKLSQVTAQILRAVQMKKM